MTAFVTLFGDRLTINCIVTVMVRPALAGMNVVVRGFAANWRLTISRRRGVLGAAAEDAVREDVQAGYDDYQLVH